MRKVVLFTGQWVDMPFAELCKRAAAMGFEGLEVACGGDHLDVRRAASDPAYATAQRDTAAAHGLQIVAISNHLVGQAVCDRIDERHRAILPARVWGDGDPEGVRQRAAEEMRLTARAAVNVGVTVVTGFTGSSIWHLAYSFPPVPTAWIDEGYNDFAKRWRPILDTYDELGVDFALEVHPTERRAWELMQHDVHMAEIAFDVASTERALAAIERHPRFCFNFDPSHFVYQNVDYVLFIRKFGDRVRNVHMKDCYVSPTPSEVGTYGGHVAFGDHRRSWNFRSLGRGSVKFEEIIRALNDVGYTGALSVEWEDTGMDREHGATESCRFVKQVNFKPSAFAFDAQFNQQQPPPPTASPQ